MRGSLGARRAEPEPHAARAAEGSGPAGARQARDAVRVGQLLVSAERGTTEIAAQGDKSTVLSELGS